ncbi:hypothetical protein, partial [Acidiphilium sp.]|uniref:hypothetical protein n=1 Tax=Acidiphilium sp. TaxID=527 RepID=UPI003CFDF0B8
ISLLQHGMSGILQASKLRLLIPSTFGLEIVEGGIARTPNYPSMSRPIELRMWGNFCRSISNHAAPASVAGSGGYRASFPPPRRGRQYRLIEYSFRATAFTQVRTQAKALIRVVK